MAVCEAIAILLAANVLPTEQVQGFLLGELRPLLRWRLSGAREGRLLAREILYAVRPDRYFAIPRQSEDPE